MGKICKILEIPYTFFISCFFLLVKYDENSLMDFFGMSYLLAATVLGARRVGKKR